MKAKTIFLDIDGTILVHHNIGLNWQISHMIPLEGSIEKFIEWDSKGYNIVLTTGRRESQRRVTEETLTSLGFFWDQLIMGIGGGDRIIINDKKPDSERETAYAINLKRNEGIKDVQI